MDGTTSDRMARIATPLADFFDHDNIEWYRRLLLEMRYAVDLRAYERFADMFAHILGGNLTFAPVTDPDEAPQAVEADVASLKRDGFVRLPGLLDATRVSEVRAYLEGQKVKDRWGKPTPGFALEETPGTINTVDYTEEQIARAPHLLEAMNHPRVIRRATGYLGVPPSVACLSLWWSLTRRDTAVHDQLYHIDRTCYRFTQLFIYLTDVDESGGPHVFVRGSHRYDEQFARIQGMGKGDPARGKRLLSVYGGRRHEDSLIEEVFGRENIVTLTGKAGDAFLVCTGGLHKGMLPVTSNRLVMTAPMSILPRERGRPKKVFMPDFLDRMAAAHADRVSMDQVAYTNRLIIQYR